ncbi:MAG: NYN domain-containing protein [Candidatus Firestonebacteria bacterium]
MWLIIDGYNVIKSTKFLDDFKFNELKNQREKFIFLMGNYRFKTNHKITIVFDGSKSSQEFVNKENVNGLEVIYSKSGQIADELIKNIVENSTNPKDILVVSSDKSVSHYARMLGASTSNSEELYSKLKIPSLTYGLTKSEYIEKYVKGYDDEENLKHFQKGLSKRDKKDKRKLKLW